jgi:hypothetical protein
MPEVIYKYQLPEEENENELHANGDKFYRCLVEMRDYLRKLVKYEDGGKEAQKIAETFYTILQEENVELDK